ncbi:MAG: CPBP family intramembrane metalloprotease [Bdellovibrionaceae bacterium]|nr:CPBP family intramembrane metalloprotease [Pseudobdellovibrionaceae bacterium]
MKNVTLIAVESVFALLNILLYSSLSIASEQAQSVQVALLFIFVLVSFKMKFGKVAHWLSVTLFLIALFSIVFVVPWPIPNVAVTVAFGFYLAKRRHQMFEMLPQFCSQKEILIALLAAVVSISGVLLWYYLLKDPGDRPSFVLHYSLLIRILIIVVFAILNAYAEEFIYRGLVFDALSKKIRRMEFVNFLQAIAFGILHFRGIPSGVVGCFLAFIFAYLMGWLRIRSRGLFIPWLAHAITDAGIAILVITN